MTGRPTVATVWLDGCSGCHMSLLDLDERLLDLLGRIELVASPLVDAKQLPEHVDLVLVEGAVSTEDDLRRIREVRARAGVLVSLGDCAVTSNVPGMRNPYGPAPLLERAYLENADDLAQLPGATLPALLAQSLPLHAVVDVDAYLPGCPPPAEAILVLIERVLRGEPPGQSATTFG